MQKEGARYVDGAGSWRSHPDGDDLAVLYLGRLPSRAFDSITSRRLLLESGLTRHVLGPGDDCFMVGRFTRPDGEQLDRPVVRFGNLAMTPHPIRQAERGFDQLSFLVDMRSVSGFSGSAVIAYYGGLFLTAVVGEGAWPRRRHPSITERHILGDWWLLGVDWGHLPVTLDLKREDGSKAGRAKVESGMAAVVPAWKVSEVLDSEDAVKERQEAEDQAEAERAEDDAVMDSAQPDSLDKTSDLLGKLMAVPKDEAREK